MRKFLKRNRSTCILIFIFVLLVVLGVIAKDMLMPDDRKPTYGDRLKDLIPVSEETYNKLDESLKKNSSVTKVSHRLQGKTIDYYITFTDKTSVKDAKTIGETVLKGFSEEELEYYSIQIFLLKDDQKLNNFPIIGMKHPKSKSVSWTKDREITVESEKDEE